MKILKRNRRKHYRHDVLDVPFFKAQTTDSFEPTFRIKDISQGGASIVWIDDLIPGQNRQISFVIMDFNLAQISQLIGRQHEESRYMFLDVGNPAFKSIFALLELGRKFMRKAKVQSQKTAEGTAIHIGHNFTYYSFILDREGLLTEFRVRIKLENRRLGFQYTNQRLQILDLDAGPASLTGVPELLRHTYSLIAVMVGSRSEQPNHLVEAAIQCLTPQIEYLKSLNQKGIKGA